MQFSGVEYINEDNAQENRKNPEDEVINLQREIELLREKSAEEITALKNKIKVLEEQRDLACSTLKVIF